MTKQVFKAMEKEANPFFVRGATFINHRIRIQLNLSMEEYAFMDFYKTYQDNGDGRITYSKVYSNVGIMPNRIPDLFRSLRDKGLLYRDKSGVVTTSKKWDDYFNANDDFNRLWDIKYPRKGNRQKAFNMWHKALKVIDPDELTNKYKQYIKYVEETGTIGMHVSSFLNPLYKHWENEEHYNYKKLIKSNKDEPPIPQTKLEDEW